MELQLQHQSYEYSGLIFFRIEFPFIPVLKVRKLEPRGKVTCAEVPLAHKPLRLNSAQVGPAGKATHLSLHHKASRGNTTLEKQARLLQPTEAQTTEEEIDAAGYIKM